MGNHAYRCKPICEGSHEDLTCSILRIIPFYTSAIDTEVGFLMYMSRATKKLIWVSERKTKD